jgi:hypothetical protein
MAMRNAVRDQLPKEIDVASESVRDKWQILAPSLPFAARTKLALAMLPFIQDKATYVRGEAAFWLGELGVTEHLPALERAFGEEPKQRLTEAYAHMAAAVWKLKFAACINDTERADVLTTAIHTQPNWISNWAVTLIGDLGIVRCRTMLETVLDNPKVIVDEKPVKTALAKLAIRAKSLLGDSITALESDDSSVRMWGMRLAADNRLDGAKEALGRIADRLEAQFKEAAKKTSSIAHILPESNLCVRSLKELGVNRDDFTKLIPINE